jgi:hypothetical protein
MLVREIVETIDIRKAGNHGGHRGDRQGYNRGNNNRPYNNKYERDNNDNFNKGTMRGHQQQRRDEEAGSWLKEDNEEKIKLKQ